MSFKEWSSVAFLSATIPEQCSLHYGKTTIHLFAIFVKRLWKNLKRFRVRGIILIQSIVYFSATENLILSLPQCFCILAPVGGRMTDSGGKPT